MASRKTLLTISYHDDDDTGMYYVGEIDFGIVGILDDYLRNFGQKGKSELIKTLGYLIYEVERQYREQCPEIGGGTASSQ